MEFKIGERAIGHSSSLKFVPRQYIWRTFILNHLQTFGQELNANYFTEIRERFMRDYWFANVNMYS
jgi:hypothetical protein